MKEDSITNEEFSRYSRQIFIEEIGVDGQRKIKNAKVLVVGAGGLGSPVIQYLAASGVGTIGIADFDRVELHNLNRQVIHTESNVGKLKTESAIAFVSALNSSVKFITINEKIGPENIQSIFQDYDLIVDGSDNFITRYLVNDTCIALDKTLVYGSIFGFEGHIAVFNYKGSKNLRNIFPEPPNQDDVPDCDKNGVLGPLPGIVGTMMAMQTLKIITDLPVTTNQLTIVDTLNWNFFKIGF
ncbi:HesA/MoeB/ThiF family protein [Elizabethkingia bruuniana]|uniref:Molybdopterin-synthase adenylyltransferase n=1 Tax=Elizabethkingia bruuniana TaxID=1756149 RepID=A0A7T7UWP8_9FLAO|nr:HesA/MoeB/ThiF family protein [Elizabethkingia bruuniana]KGO10202.1 thiamine biosynthesis protein ThiF [Elizabethkingia miricola]AQX84106.1 thiamine biosynthesis protein ThiF [Elizabethkingia bruuniana]KUY28283.1 thiamine biosynthesis protein ThiF [Elizabethkingia bruuniana]OPB64525.1 thiamine biosynthesis protein ThiF [Elizabethkingia bruuniana]QDZ63173.1 HesA/MoeB/ThiF family protein [Elizabethkingia bruuniana]